jgi:hypothetical protein
MSEQVNDTRRGDGLPALDLDVAEWLHMIADKHYDGDFETALNDALRAVMSRETPPKDPWATITMMNRMRAAGRSRDPESGPGSAE